MKRSSKNFVEPQKSKAKEIKYASDWQRDWTLFVPELRKYEIQSVDFLSISGDAPKDFVKDSEYRPGYRSKRNPRDKYIAKVGSKFYPLESVIEQLITRIGQCLGVNIAESKLRTIDGQVRFLSKYFLKGGEILTHGAEIYEYSIGKKNYSELSKNKGEADFFSFQMTCEAIEERFPDNTENIIKGYVEMLVFDAIIGHNDRHPYNWGVIVPLRKSKLTRFSPIFDTARALFWNIPEKRVENMLENKMAFESYINKCKAPVNWDKNENIDFFELIALIWKEFSFCKEHVEKFSSADKLNEIEEILSLEFEELISENRRKLIMKCLHHRHREIFSRI